VNSRYKNLYVTLSLVVTPVREVQCVLTRSDS